MVSAVRALILKGGTVHPVSAAPFIGDVRIENGRIAALGKALDETGAEVIDVSGLNVIPGIVDPHCHIGLSESDVGSVGQDENEHSSPILPELRAVDAINPADSSFRDAREAGVTTCVTGPGSSGLIMGQFAAVKTWGRVVEDMVLRAPLCMKFALGENPKLAHGKNRKASPETRMAEASMLRNALLEARACANRMDTSAEASQNLRQAELARVFQGLPVKIHTHRADDIMTALRIVREFGLKASIDHCTEGHLIPEYIADAVRELDIRVILGPLLMPRRKNETAKLSLCAPATLHGAGISFGLMSDHPVTPLQYLNVYAALAVREGLPREAALRAITLDAARAAWIDDRVGSIEVGKDADIAVFEGEPLSSEGRCMLTLINGRVVHNRIHRA